MQLVTAGHKALVTPGHTRSHHTKFTLSVRFRQEKNDKKGQNNKEGEEPQQQLKPFFDKKNRRKPIPSFLSFFSFLFE